MFKIAKVWPDLSQMLGTMRKTLGSIGYTCVLLYLFVLIYTILGMELFAYHIQFDQNNRPVGAGEG